MIREPRRALGWSQERLAEEIERHTGQRIDQGTISAIENGRTPKPTYDTVVGLAKALDIDVRRLLRIAGYPAVSVDMETPPASPPIRTYDDVAQLLKDYAERQIAAQVQAALRSIRLPIVNALSAQDAGNLDRQVTDTIEVPPWLVEGVGDPVLFIVAGECLGADDIRTGDLVIIDRSITDPHDGEIVAARVNGEETLKHYHHLGDRVELRPSAPGFAPIVVREGSVEIIGVYAGVMRRAGRGRR